MAAQGLYTPALSAKSELALAGSLNHGGSLWRNASGRLLKRWNARAKNPWHRTGAAILAVGFSGSPSTFYPLARDGRLVELRRS